MRDDIEFNIKFCQLVQNQPDLYDYNRSSYNSRSVQDKAWEWIAQELNESVADCRERWKNIRGRYGKVVKAQHPPSGSAPNKMKDYYLGPHLRFLDNFLKTRAPKSCTKALERTDTFSDDEKTSGFESNSSLPNSTHANSASPVTAYTPSTSATSVNEKIPTLQDVHKSAYEFFSAKKQRLINKKIECIDSQLDLCFLKSMLPDMLAMTPLQKRRFKIGVLNLSANILAENENIITTRAGSESPFSTPGSIT